LIRCKGEIVQGALINKTISIITPSLNRAEFIKRVIESVLHQGYPDVEHIVVDGVSTDGTHDILKQYPHLKVIMEPDQSVYDAFNKGIQVARGDIIGLLNTDDCYSPDIFFSVAECFQMHPEADLICGGATFFVCQNGEEKIFLRLPPVTAEDLPERSTIGIPAINSCFFRKEVFSRIGFFNLDYRCSADRDFLLRVAIANLKLVSIQDKNFYCYLSHPGSLTIYDVWKPVILDENLRLTEIYGEQKVDSPVRKACLKWERRYTQEIVGHFILQCDINSTQKYFLRMCKRRWWWPAYFAIMFPFTVYRYWRQKTADKTMLD
jgi:glycosyltransferase involved in cell wall biosynthesis